MNKREQMNSAEIKQIALNNGADLVGIAKAEYDSEESKRLHDFIKHKRHANMTWLEDIEKRCNPDSILPGAKSAIVIAVNYYRKRPPAPQGHGIVARYAYGRDYHKVLKDILGALSTEIQKANPEAKTRACVDSAPLPERRYAVKAGLGFIGKNGTLITNEYGSFVLLGVLLTDLELQYDQPQKTGTCGTCTRCIDACPTKAILKPYTINAGKCVSYLTIEHKGPIPSALKKQIQNRLFGCDTCQEVCPYNITNAKPAKPRALNKSLHKKIAGVSIPLKEIQQIKTEEDFTNRFAGSPLMRPKLDGLKRNAKIVKDNQANID